MNVFNPGNRGQVIQWANELATATDYPALERLAAERPEPLLLAEYWLDVLTALRSQLDEIASDGGLDVSDQTVDIHIRAWNVVGISLIQAQRPELGEEVFLALLSEMRAVQPQHGRVHKGTPYHQIGVARLARGDADGAREYFEFAAIEDMLNGANPADDVPTPAIGTLRMTFGLTANALAEWWGNLRTIIEAEDSRIGELTVENPELLFIGHARPVELNSPPAEESDISGEGF